MDALYQIEAIGEKTMRDFDAAYLVEADKMRHFV